MESLRSDPVSILSKGTDTFGVELLSTLLDSSKGETTNVVISAYSISTCLAMAAAGSAGNTLKEFLSVLHLEKLTEEQQKKEMNALASAYQQIMTKMSSAQTKELTLKMANALLTVPKFQLFPEFSDAITKQFGATTKVVQDVHIMVKELNEWCAAHTEGKIKQILTELDPECKLVLLNAIYFKGLFEVKFESSQTKPADFQSLDGPEECNLMYRKGKKLLYHETAEFQSVELPYKGNQASLVIFLPNQTGAKGVEAVIHSMKASDVFTRFREREGQLWLPRFTTEAKLNLKSLLPKMGLKDAFSENAADFSGISPQQNGLYISDAVHKAFIEVNEEGTEAAAATAIGIRAMAFIQPMAPFVMRVDRPFIFAIRHRGLGSTLFIGVIHHPGKK